ncbi:MAG: DNA repair protein RadC [Methanomicrobiales archaeon]|nr:DNA repair protein RadC [Methanomicrobiales archaeon]
MKDISVQDRPREKIAKRGAKALSDVELIALILGMGTKKRDVFAIATDIAQKISQDAKYREYELLCGIDGLGPAKAAQIAACFELARRHLLHEPEKFKITSPRDVLPLVAPLAEKKQEYFHCITLNGAGEVIENRMITVGLLNHSLVHPREVFAEAITDRAASVILVHNHPSGTMEPSAQDIAITHQLSEAGQILGIRVLDHLIVTRKGFVSMREKGLV